MSHKWNYFVCAKSELYTFNDYWITRSPEWQLFTTYQTVFSHLIKLVKVVKNKFVEKIANHFSSTVRPHQTLTIHFETMWLIYSDEYVLYADLLPVCDGIYRNTTTVLPSVCNAKKRLRRSLASFVEKFQISLTNRKLIAKLIFLAFL